MPCTIKFDISNNTIFIMSLSVLIYSTILYFYYQKLRTKHSLIKKVQIDHEIHQIAQENSVELKIYFTTLQNTAVNSSYPSSKEGSPRVRIRSPKKKVSFSEITQVCEMEPTQLLI